MPEEKIDIHPSKLKQLTGQTKDLENYNVIDAVSFSSQIVQQKKFKNCSFTSFIIYNPQNGINLTFTNCHFSSKESFTVTNSRQVIIEFINCTFDGNIEFNLSSNTLTTNFNSCIVLGEITYLQITTLNAFFNSKKEGEKFLGQFPNIKITKSNITKLEALNARIGNLNSCNNKLINNLEIHSSTIDFFSNDTPISNFEAIDSYIFDLDISNTTVKNANFFRLNSNSFKLRNLKNTRIKLLDCSFLNTQMDGIQQEAPSMIEIIGCKFLEEFKLGNEITERVKISNTDFKSQKIDLFDADLIKFEFYNVRWPKKNQLTEIESSNDEKQEESTEKKLQKELIEDKSQEKKEIKTKAEKKIEEYERHSKLREQYRQLKNISVKSGNKIDALSFYRNEMMHYSKSIKDNPDVAWKDKCILWINENTGDFGQDWIKPLILLFIFNMIFFLIMIRNGYLGYSFCYGENCIFNSDIIYEYGKLISPFRKSIISGNNATIEFLDTAMRLFSSFFIYNIIRAGRKFAPKI